MRIYVIDRGLGNCPFYRRRSAGRTGDADECRLLQLRGSPDILNECCMYAVAADYSTLPILLLRKYTPGFGSHRKMKHLTDNVGNGLAIYLSGRYECYLFMHQVSAWVWQQKRTCVSYALCFVGFSLGHRYLFPPAKCSSYTATDMRPPRGPCTNEIEGGAFRYLHRCMNSPFVGCFELRRLYLFASDICWRKPAYIYLNPGERACGVRIVR